jgi:hypothetical protein
MKNLPAIFFFFFALISCEEQKKIEQHTPLDISPIDSNAPKELSVAEVEAMMKDGGSSPTFQYQGVIGFGGTKEYVFTCDSGKRIQFELVSDEDNVVLDIQKEMWTHARLDAEKVTKVKAFVHVSDSLSYIETCKKTFRFKTILKLDPESSDSSSVGKYQLKTFVE